MLRITPRGAPARLAPTVTGMAALSFAVFRVSLVAWIIMAGLLGLLSLTFIILVVCPAIWSRRKTRRDAAFKVLDSLMK